MGQSFTPSNVRIRFVAPLSDLAESFSKLCEDWERAYESRAIHRPDLLLNNATAEAGIFALRKFCRESRGKLDDAISGTYRYRDRERRDKCQGRSGVVKATRKRARA